jgi:outer membrane lipoprotein-sorting protein
MRHRLGIALVGLLLASAAHAQNLEAVLGSMDRAAANFRSAQTDFVWDQYQKVVDEHDLQKGTMYFRRQGDDVQMAADITSPDRKHVLFTGGVVKVYVPKVDQVTEYDAGKNKAEFETFLVLGFGGSGKDLERSFDVKFDGMEEVQGVSTGKLELTPKSQKVRNMFSTITLWIDPTRGVSLQQKFQEPSGDYRLATYSDIELNKKINGDVFKLKTTSKTKYVRPNG